jgi:hypothetical protein
MTIAHMHHPPSPKQQMAIINLCNLLTVLRLTDRYVVYNSITWSTMSHPVGFNGATREAVYNWMYYKRL